MGVLWPGLGYVGTCQDMGIHKPTRDIVGLLKIYIYIYLVDRVGEEWGIARTVEKGMDAGTLGLYRGLWGLGFQKGGSFSGKGPSERMLTFGGM